MKVQQYNIYIVNLDPTIGSEIKKKRPCVVISPNDLNDNLNTVLIAPLTTSIKDVPFRVSIQGNSNILDSSIALDQIRCIDKRRITKNVGHIPVKRQNEIKAILNEMLCL